MNLERDLAIARFGQALLDQQKCNRVSKDGEPDVFDCDYWPRACPFHEEENRKTKGASMPEYRGRITIDGKGVFDYVLTSAEGQEYAITGPGNAAGTVNIPPAQNRQVSTADGDVFTGTLLKHEMKSGTIAAGKKRAGERWVKHSFRGSDNRWYHTFDDKIASALSKSASEGTIVKFVAKANDFKGFDVQRILGS